VTPFASTCKRFSNSSSPGGSTLKNTDTVLDMNRAEICLNIPLTKANDLYEALSPKTFHLWMPPTEDPEISKGNKRKLLKMSGNRLAKKTPLPWPPRQASPLGYKMQRPLTLSASLGVQRTVRETIQPMIMVCQSCHSRRQVPAEGGSRSPPFRKVRTSKEAGATPTTTSPSPN
jgi:hypothetical protein